MKIFIIPYTFYTYFSFKERVSGVDESMLKQIEVLREKGHDVKAYTIFGNLHEYLNDICYYDYKIPEIGIKPYVKDAKNRKKIITDILIKIKKFKPDIILSNAYYQRGFYNELQKINIPIIYMCHAAPGFLSDLMCANKLSDFSERHSICAMSEYHAQNIKQFYNRKRKNWNFEKEINVDSVVFSSYSNKEKVLNSDGVIRHVSAANKDKQTFLVHDFLNKTDFKTEVYTTLNHMTKDNETLNTYVEKAFKNFNTSNRSICLDIEHKTIMENIGKSACCFVGLAYYDSFTITSLEALSRGVPIIVKGIKKLHPAKEMVEPKYQKYVHIYENKKDFIDKVKEFSNITMEERKQIANSCYRITSKNMYGNKLEKALNNAILKFNNKNSLHLENFMI